MYFWGYTCVIAYPECSFLYTCTLTKQCLEIEGEMMRVFFAFCRYMHILFCSYNRKDTHIGLFTCHRTLIAQILISYQKVADVLQWSQDTCFLVWAKWKLWFSKNRTPKSKNHCVWCRIWDSKEIAPFAHPNISCIPIFSCTVKPLQCGMHKSIKQMNAAGRNVARFVFCARYTNHVDFFPLFISHLFHWKFC